MLTLPWKRGGIRGRIIHGEHKWGKRIKAWVALGGQLCDNGATIAIRERETEGGTLTYEAGKEIKTPAECRIKKLRKGKNNTKIKVRITQA